MNPFLRILLGFLSILTFLVIFIPFYIYRAFVILLAKFTLPSGSEIIAPSSAMFSPCFSSVTPLGGVIASIIFQNTLDPTKVSQTVSLQIEKHSKLRSVPILYGLYTFWTPLKEFKLQNHVVQMVYSDGDLVPIDESSKSGTICPQNDLLHFKKTLLSAPFAKGQSPWMIYIVKNVQHPLHGVVDVLIFKWHHGLADGLSIIKVLGDSMDPPIGREELPWKPLPFWVELATGISAVTGILEAAFSGPLGFTPSVVSPPENQLKKGEAFFLSESNPIGIDSIKGIKNANNVAFSTVGLAALSSALRTLADQKIRKNEDIDLKIIPESVPTSLILPYPGHPNDELVNHWTCAIIPLPLNGSLPEINELGKRCRSQGLINFKRISLFGRLPFLFHGFIMAPHCIAYSDLPGPRDRFRIWGSECLDMSFNIHIPPGLFGICCSSLSYDGKWKIAFNVDAAVCSTQEEADTLGHLVSKYIHEMDA